MIDTMTFRALMNKIRIVANSLFGLSFHSFDHQRILHDLKGMMAVRTRQGKQLFFHLEIGRVAVLSHTASSSFNLGAIFSNTSR